jgi:ribosomal subunit interface protein
MSRIQIIVRSITDSPTIDYHVIKYFKKINKIYPRISNCRVVIDAPQRHKHKGKMFSINIDITIPGKEVVCRKQNQNLYVAIRDGFSAIEKLLEKSTKKRKNTLGVYDITGMSNPVKQQNVETVRL